MISLTQMVTGTEIGREAASEPEECAYLLQALARHGNDEFREELSHHLQDVLDQEERGAVRDLALMIAGACGEAE